MIDINTAPMLGDLVWVWAKKSEKYAEASVHTCVTPCQSCDSTAPSPAPQTPTNHNHNNYLTTSTCLSCTSALSPPPSPFPTTPTSPRFAEILIRNSPLPSPRVSPLLRQSHRQQQQPHTQQQNAACKSKKCKVCIPLSPDNPIVSFGPPTAYLRILFLVAIHGNEYCGVSAVNELMREGFFHEISKHKHLPFNVTVILGTWQWLLQHSE